MTVSNPEVFQRWCTMSLYVGYSTAYTTCENWLGSQGVIKYLNAVYSACDQSDDSGAHAMCVGWFNNNINYYTPMASAVVANALNV